MTRVTGSLDDGRVSFGDKAEIEEARATDPVCGMEFGRADAEAASEYHGQIYFFCSRACKDEFDADPASYQATSVVNTVPP